MIGLKGVVRSAGAIDNQSDDPPGDKIARRRVVLVLLEDDFKSPVPRERNLDAMTCLTGYFGDDRCGTDADVIHPDISTARLAPNGNFLGAALQDGGTTRKKERNADESHRAAGGTESFQFHR